LKKGKRGETIRRKRVKMPGDSTNIRVKTVNPYFFVSGN